MRKLVGALIIVAVVSGYIWMTKGQYKNEENTITQEAQKDDTVGAKIQAIDEKLDASYPSKAKDVVEIHNELMGICYKNKMSDSDIKDYVATIRKIYTKEFNDLNSEENQVAGLKQEQPTIGPEGMQLVVSEITETYVAKDDTGEEVGAEVNVRHTTNLGSMERTYFLSKEDGKWKINGWETAK